VPTSRTVSAGTGLSGGGSLASNRTLSIDRSTVDGWYASAGHTHSSLESAGTYIWSSSDAPSTFRGALQSAAGRNVSGNPDPGWPGQYGKIHWFGTMSSNDGAGLQLWVPYRSNADGSPSSDGSFSFRTGRYSNEGWT